MTNWLLRILLSVSLTFILFQGFDRQSPSSQQNSICAVQPVILHQSNITKVQAEDKDVLNKPAISSHKKQRCLQKLIVADNEDDDDNDDLISARKYITGNCFFSNFLLPESPSDFTKTNLATCQYLSVLSTGKHLLLCTLRI